MFKRQQSKSTTISKFYQGDNIMSHLKNSLFGKIKKIYEQDKTNKLYQLPKVIVIGTESSGKSSLLERITKCQLFPSDSKLCTKCPIKVKLQNGTALYSIQLPGNTIQQLENKKDIYPIVQNYMNSLSNDIIYKDEIIINITDIDVPDFEFYDLPGIRTYPQNVADLSVNICKKYLSDKNSIVLCVVPCTTTRLTSCQSIALVKEAKMDHNTILALTMTDRLQEDDISELLINRIIDKTDELNGIKFANCIAVVNRSQYTNYSLEESDQKEKEWFDENIYECIFREQIIMNTSISNLLKSMDNLYNRFIKTDWIPRMLLEMRSKEYTIINQIKEIKLFKPVITKDNFPEFLSLCLDSESAKKAPKLTRDNIGKTLKRSSVLTRNNIGETPIQPYEFFKSVRLCIPVEGGYELEYIMIGDLTRDEHIYRNKNDEILAKLQGLTYTNYTEGGDICKSIQVYETILSNFNDKNKIKYTLKDNIFNIPIKQLVNPNKNFDKLFIKYIKQRFNEKLLKIIKRNVINKLVDECCMSNIYGRDTAHNVPLATRLHNFCWVFHNIFYKMIGLQNIEINDFILQNLTIDFFTESKEDILKIENELKFIQSNIVSLETYT